MTKSYNELVESPFVFICGELDHENQIRNIAIHINKLKELIAIDRQQPQASSSIPYVGTISEDQRNYVNRQLDMMAQHLKNLESRVTAGYLSKVQALES